VHVFAVRLVDRVGKGLRGAPRDAMLGALAPEEQRGRVFGYHRGMDHAGAVVGPLAAALFLWFFPGEYRTLFALTIIPGALAVATVVLVPETRSGGADRPTGTLTTAHPTLPLPRPLKRFLISLTLFTLGNSTDAFLLLRLSDAGLAAAYLPVAWAGLHAVKAGLSTRGGALSDRLGRRPLIVAGWLWYAVVYVGFAMSDTLIPLLIWFCVYGIYYAMVEGSERALIADLTPAHLQGTSFGWYNAVLGFGALGASVLFGALWEWVSPAVAFMSGASLAVMAAILLATAPAAEKTQ
jgi:MFS family permease